MTTFPGETQLYLFPPFCQLHVSLPWSQTWPHYCPSADGWEPQKPQLENSDSLCKNIGFLLSPFGVPTERAEEKKCSVLSDFLTCLKGYDFGGGVEIRGFVCSQHANRKHTPKSDGVCTDCRLTFAMGMQCSLLRRLPNSSPVDFGCFRREVKYSWDFC